jgi:hypothetical protein
MVKTVQVAFVEYSPSVDSERPLETRYRSIDLELPEIATVSQVEEAVWNLWKQNNPFPDRVARLQSMKTYVNPTSETSPYGYAVSSTVIGPRDAVYVKGILQDGAPSPYSHPYHKFGGAKRHKKRKSKSVSRKKRSGSRRKSRSHGKRSGSRRKVR